MEQDDSKCGKGKKCQTMKDVGNQPAFLITAAVILIGGLIYAMYGQRQDLDTQSPIDHQQNSAIPVSKR